MNRFAGWKIYNEWWRILWRYLQRIFRRWYVPTGLLLLAFALTIPFTTVVKALALNDMQGQEVVDAKNTAPVVQAVFFYSPTCGHCHLVLNETLIPMQEALGEELQIIGIDTSTPEGSQLFGAVIAKREIPPERQGVPMLLVGDLILVGSGEIPEQLPGLVENGLAASGIGWSDIPGWDELFAEQVESIASPATAGADGSDSEPASKPVSEPASAAPKPAAIEEGIEEAIEEAAAEENPAQAETQAPVYLAYFYDPTCLECARVSDDLAKLEAQYPQLVARKFNLRDEAILNEAMADKFHVAETYRLLAPSIFIGDEFLPPDEITLERLQTQIGNPSVAAMSEPWAGLKSAQSAATSNIVARFQQFGLLAVAGAGLLDGVNPCAFTTIIFFVSYLALVGRQGREILYVGFAFTLAVFITYLALGFGLLEILQRVGAFTLIGQIIYGVTAVVCVVLAWLSLRDYFKIRRGELTNIALQLPKRLKRRIHTTIRTRSRMNGYVAAAFGAGALVSVFELACTGQVYLPTIIFVMGLADERLRALGLLALYNFMFIVPLVAVFLLTYWGTTNRQLTDWFQSHAGTVKLCTAGFFGLLGVWLGYMVLIV